MSRRETGLQASPGGGAYSQLAIGLLFEDAAQRPTGREQRPEGEGERPSLLGRGIKAGIAARRR